MGVNGEAAAFAEQSYPTTDVVSRAEYERVRDTAIRDHELMQSRIDNQEQIIDRLGKANAALRMQASECQTCRPIP